MAIVSENHGGRFAKTIWKRLWYNESRDISLLEVKIMTGRTHQIRVHLSSLGFPLLGDRIYAPDSCMEMAPRQMLHAWRISFKHPVTGLPLSFESPIPEDFMQAMEDLRPDYPLVVITGNQGCGKSAICKLLAGSGFPVISADAVVNELYEKPGPVKDWLETRLFHDVLKKDGSIDKSVLFTKFQQNPEMRNEFESFVHALVLDNILAFQKENSNKTYVIAEIPLYFECNWQNWIIPRPIAIGIHCDENIRWQRLQKNRGWSMDKIKTLEQWQWLEDRKMAACDLVINNNGAKNNLEQGVAQIKNYLQVYKEANSVDFKKIIQGG